MNNSLIGSRHEHGSSVLYQTHLFMRLRVWQFLDCSVTAPLPVQHLSILYRAVTTLFILLLLLVNSQDMTKETSHFYTSLESLAAVLFTLEYLLRIYSCVEEDHNDDHRTVVQTCRVRLARMIHPSMLLDAFSILSLYLDLSLSHKMFRGMVALRVLNLCTLLRLGRRFQVLDSMFKVFERKRRELATTIVLAGLLLVISSAIVYYIECEKNPQFSSMGEALWWGTAALTTVGYGDIYPITNLGKFVAAIAAFIGIGLFSLPAGILASGFKEVFDEDHASAHEDMSELPAIPSDRVREISTRLDSLSVHVEQIGGAVKSLQCELSNIQATQQRILDVLEAQTRHRVDGAKG